jgi:acetylornithine deacetylase
MMPTMSTSLDPLTSLLVDYIEIPSVTGDEEDYGNALARSLEQRGLAVERQEVEPGRFNLLARAGQPEVVFCTHLDTVPPFFGSRVDADFVYGRGSCDAKGQAVSMLSAVENLLNAGEDRVGLLFTVGEEVLGDGAMHANASLADPWAPRFIVVGEPTGSRFVKAHKGVFHAQLTAHGVAGHSSQDIGPSAVHELVQALERILAAKWGRAEGIGSGTVNLGCIEGGVAPNVVAEFAKASFLLRSVEDPAVVQDRLLDLLGEHVELRVNDGPYGPVRFHVPEGEEGVVVAFGTDAPYLPKWGQPLLFGPGAIIDAHTDHEKVSRSEMAAASARLVSVAEELLSSLDASAT